MYAILTATQDIILNKPLLQLGPICRRIIFLQKKIRSSLLNLGETGAKHILNKIEIFRHTTLIISTHIHTYIYIFIYNTR